VIEQIGFIGAGRMGGRMVRRLVGAGFAVVVCDRDQAALDAAAAGGARVADGPAAAAAGSQALLCSLPTPTITEAALAGALDAVAPGTVVVDLGTGDPETARRIAAACESAGAHFLDAPVSRGVAAAESGTLAILAGGDERALELARPVLSELASDIVHVGPVGAGQVAKLCNNMLAAINATALGEVLVAGVRAGVELDALAAAIGAGSGGSFVLERYLPAGLFTAERPTGFSLALMRKDVGLFLAACDDLGLPAPISALVAQQYAAAHAEGRDDADWTSVAEVYERPADVRLALRAEVAS
jgi:3-hydroxyisobutyrate dehydrogenase